MNILAGPFAVLLLVGLLQLKHLVCDGSLQTRSMIAGKGTYGAAGGLVHAGIHGIGSLVVLAGFGFSLWLAVLLAAAEAVSHYHIDFAKERLVRAAGWTPREGLFWWALGFDQWLHQVTYLALVAVAAMLG